MKLRILKFWKNTALGLMLVFLLFAGVTFLAGLKQRALHLSYTSLLLLPCWLYFLFKYRKKLKQVKRYYPNII